MKAAITGVRSALGPRKLLASSGAFAALAVSIAAFGGDARWRRTRRVRPLATGHRRAPRVERGPGRSRASARRARAHPAYAAFARLRESQVPVPRLGSAAAMRRSSTDRSPACRPISPI